MRIFAISDQHGKLDFQLPQADLILHAGDICPDFAPHSNWGNQMQELWLQSKWSNWIGSRKVLATFGNHDFVNRCPESMNNIKVDELVEFNGLKIWFSPWSNQFGIWAWMAPPLDLEQVYSKIPEGLDILVSHGPAYGFGDKVGERYIYDDQMDPHVGSKELLAVIERMKPKVLICGHIHSGWGIYQHGPTTIYNVALLNEDYQRVNEPMQILL